MKKAHISQSSIFHLGYKERKITLLTPGKRLLRIKEKRNYNITSKSRLIQFT